MPRSRNLAAPAPLPSAHTPLASEHPHASPLASVGRMLTIADAIEFTGLSESLIRRAIRRRQLASLQFGRAVRIAEADLATWIASRRRSSR